jgi:hypothetical protein
LIGSFSKAPVQRLELMLESDMFANIDIKRQPHVAEVAKSILTGAKKRKVRTTLNSRQSPTNSKDRQIIHGL